MFRQVYIVLVAVITLSVLVDSRTVHRDHSLGIVGGDEATAHESPSTVLLDMFKLDSSGKRKYVGPCGANLISEKYLLTAGHCVDKMEGTLVYLGIHDKEDITGGENQTVLKDNFILHPEVDLALIELSSSVTFNKNINKANLPLKKDANETYVGQKGTAFGWGRLDDEGTLPRYLMKVGDLRVVTFSGCDADSYRICTSGDDYTGTCRGDSGGPLFINNVLVAVITGGNEVCESRSPSSYIKTGLFLKWIGDKTGIEFP